MVRVKVSGFRLNSLKMELSLQKQISFNRLRMDICDLSATQYRFLMYFFCFSANGMSTINAKAVSLKRLDI